MKDGVGQNVSFACLDFSYVISCRFMNFSTYTKIQKLSQTFLHRRLLFNSISSLVKLGFCYWLNKGEYVVERCWLTRCVKRTPSMICGHSSGCAFSTFIKAFFIVLFWISTRPFDWEWYCEVMRCSTPVRSWKQVYTPLKNYLP